MCVNLCVTQRLTSFLFALFALSHSSDVLKQPSGEANTPVGSWGEPGRIWKVLPSFHTPATSHTDSASNRGVCACVFLWAFVCSCKWRVRAYMCMNALVHILCLLRITLHGCTNCLRSAVIFTQSAVERHVLRVSERHYSARYGKAFDLSGPSHTQCLVQWTSSLLGRWEETQKQHSLTGLISILSCSQSDALYLLIHCLCVSVFKAAQWPHVCLTQLL